MSRIGRNPVSFSDKVQVIVQPDNQVVIRGPKGTLKVAMKTQIKATVEDKKIVFTRADEMKETKSLHGLYRALVNNAVHGVTEGFTKGLILNGVGFRAAVSGRKMELSLGFSHPVIFDIPEGIEIKVDKQTNVHVVGANRELVGQVAAKIRALRPPEPYLGKGIKYEHETIRRKAGKAAGK